MEEVYIYMIHNTLNINLIYTFLQLVQFYIPRQYSVLLRL